MGGSSRAERGHLTPATPKSQMIRDSQTARDAPLRNFRPRRRWRERETKLRPKGPVNIWRGSARRRRIDRRGPTRTSKADNWCQLAVGGRRPATPRRRGGRLGVSEDFPDIDVDAPVPVDHVIEAGLRDAADRAGDADAGQEGVPVAQGKHGRETAADIRLKGAKLIEVIDHGHRDKGKQALAQLGAVGQSRIKGIKPLVLMLT